MEERLQNSAAEGDVEALYSLLAEDPFILERIDRIPFLNSPLHIAVYAEKIHFAKEIVNLKPSFAWKRDHLGRSPIHVALERGHQELLTWFLTIDRDLVRAKAKGMVTPLHYAAEKDDFSNLADFLYVCPSSIKDLTVKCETAVHVALKNKSFRAFNVLLGWLRHFDKDEILNWQDEGGNTALHIATSTDQPEVMKLLIGNIDVNKKNKEGLTALDIFYIQQDSLSSEVGKILCRAKAKRASQLHTNHINIIASRLFSVLTIIALPFPLVYVPVPGTTTFAEYLTGNLSIPEKTLRLVGMGGVSINKIPGEIRNVVLVVATLTATTTYQAALSPPGGYWQDNGSNNATISTTVDEGQSEHNAGHIILGSSLIPFFAFNSVAFYASVCTILIVIIGLRFSRILCLSSFLLFSAYQTAVTGTWENEIAWILLAIGATAAYYIPTFLGLKERKLKYYGRGILCLGGFE